MPIRPNFIAVQILAAVLILAACSRTDQEKAREEAAAAQQKAHEDADRAGEKAKELGHEAKQEIKHLDARMNDALKGRTATGDDSGAGAREKLDHAGEVAKAKGHEAARKLDEAAIVARLKTQFANDIGTASITNVDVKATGGVVTLTGTVASEDERRQAEQDAAKLDGVTKVVNNLTVKP